MLKNLVKTYGKEKINSFTRYPSILTLHKMDRGVLTDVITTDISGETLHASEKIDGTNVRLIFWGDEFLVGSRKQILHYSNDLFWDDAMDIVNQFYSLNIPIIQPDKLTIVYGELYGGKVTANSKNYGKEQHGYRVFDVAVFDDLSILDKPIEQISKWRESTINSSVSEQLRYGQPFVDLDTLKQYNYELVPRVEFHLDSLDHASVLNALKQFIPTTNVALTDTAKMGTEGVVLRNHDRSKIVKLRFEDYEKWINFRTNRP